MRQSDNSLFSRLSQFLAAASIHFAPFRLQSFAAACIAFCFPFAFSTVYEPINESWTVKLLGCSCPKLDGAYPAFNANDFNVILWAGVFAFSTWMWFLACRGLFHRPPIRLLLIPTLLIALNCLRYYCHGVWV